MLDSLKPLHKEDFNLQDLLAPIDAHTKDIDNLLSRVKTLEDKYGSPTQLANTLLETSKEAVKMSEMHETCFLNLLNKNESARNSIQEIVKITDRNFLMLKIKQWMGWIAGAFIFIMGAISNEFIKWLSHLLTH